MRNDELLAPPDARTPPPDRTSAVYQLHTLRTLLERDYLAAPDWHFAIRDILEMVSISLGQVSAMLAFWDTASSTWSAFVADGKEIHGKRSPPTAPERFSTGSDTTSAPC